MGDLSLAIDAMVKDEVCKLTGKDEYEAGDLSVEIDTRVKAAAAKFAGKETYEVTGPHPLAQWLCTQSSAS